MKKLFLFAWVIFIISSANGQTKNSNLQDVQIKPTLEETKAWIKEKIDTYGYEEQGLDPLSHNYTVTYENNDYLVIKKIYKTMGPFGDKLEVETLYRIPIKLMSKIYFEEKESNVWLTIKLKDNIDSIERIYRNEKTYTNKIDLLLSKRIKDDNLMTRLTNAFNDLINGCGGKVVKEAY